MMQNKINPLVVARWLIGLLLIVTSLEKLIGPYQNFLYVLQAYKALPPLLEEATARFFPWVELFVGLFLLLGLWTKWALRGALVLFVVFMTVIGQALIRHLDIGECGCFGQLISVPPQKMIIFDGVLFCLVALMLIRRERASALSLDRYFEKNK